MGLIFKQPSAKAVKMVLALKTYASFGGSEDPVPTDLVENMETVLTLYTNQLKTGIEIIRNYDKNLPHIQTCPDEILQVWTNLIHNAIHAMNGQGQLIIEIKNKNDFLEVVITDSGEGILEEDKGKIFEAFFTTKPMGVGSGLGLSIVKKIIDKHKGRVDFTSENGKTSFCVLLPVQ